MNRMAVFQKQDTSLYKQYYVLHTLGVLDGDMTISRLYLPSLDEELCIRL